jgi:mono/diheme cytochrome c family protein
MRRLRLLLALGLLLPLTTIAKPQAKTAPKGKGAAAKSEQYFQRVVKPMLAQNCGNCHDGKKKKEGGLDLSTSEKIIEGGSTGAGIMPGNAKESLLIQVLLPMNMPHMPPKGQLPPVQINAIAKWIDGLKEGMDAPEPEEKTTKAKPKEKEKSEEAKPAPKAEVAPADDETLAGIKLNLAKRFEKDGLTVSARTRYKDIIAKYPKTKAADEARERLAKLEKK